MSQPTDPASRRRADAQELADRLARVRAVETQRARALVAEFVADAVRLGLTPGPLLARSGDGRRTCRSGLVGWYLHRDGSNGVTVDGDYVDLVTALPWRARLTGGFGRGAGGVTLRAADPPLQVGAGARDGESIALRVLLAMRLDAGDDWPIHRP